MNKSVKSLILEALLLGILMTVSEGLFISVISIILHEFTHIVVGQVYGCKLYDFNIRLTGANAKLEEINDLKDFQKLNLYLSGPLLNLLIFVFCFCINRAFNNSYMELIGEVNLGLFIFNIIPAYPLDGSRVLEVIIAKWGTYRIAKKIVNRISYVFVSFLILIFISQLLSGKLQLGLLLISGLIIYSTHIEGKSTSYIMMDNLFKKGSLIEKYEYIENRSVSVSYKNNLLNLLRMVDRNKFNIFYVLDEELSLLIILNEDKLIDGLKNYGNISIEEYLKLEKVE